VRGVLRLAPFRRLLAAYTLNELAWSLASLALSYLIYRRTGSALGSAAFFLCTQFVPALISPLVVARLDRLHSARVLPLLYPIEGAAYLLLALVAKRAPVPIVLLVVTLDGVIALTARSLARAASTAVTAGAGLLREGNALANSLFTVCFMAGPAIGGVIVFAGGTTTALIVVAALFALITVVLATAHGLPESAAAAASPTGRIRAALAHARERPMVRTLLCVQAALLVFFTISIPVEVVYAQHTLHAGAAGYGILLSAWGGGAVAGSTIYARWRRLPARELIALGSTLLAGGFIVMAVAPSLAVAVIGSAVAGMGNGIEAVASRTALQELVDPEWMALMMSLHGSLSQAMPGLGILLGGAIAASASPRAALALAGIGALAMTMAGWVALRPKRRLARPHIERPAHRTR
jgi:predicted MFS family arabinose efflux permease